jgi:predicted MPP superfamily phosphohydrolase
MPKKISRRTFLKGLTGTILTSIGLSAGGYFYARDIETRLLDIVEHEIEHTQIPKSFNQFKIIQFSDTHIGFQYTLKQLTKLVTEINQLKPDLIFFTGDLIDEPNKFQAVNELVPILKQLDAPFGKFAIYGNHDHGGYGTDIYKNILQNAGFTLLLNESRPIQLIDHSSIYVVGIDDAMLGKPDLEKALHLVPEDSFKILLSHAPDLADQASPLGIQLQLSGHSHGGQIKIPLVGALVTPPYARNYHEGFYTVGESASSLSLYVNRGLGTTRLPFRFLSKPELTVFTLKQRNS